MVLERKQDRNFTMDRKIHEESNFWSTAQSKKSVYLMLMFSLDETIDQMALANSFHLYGHVLRREDGHV